MLRDRFGPVFVRYYWRAIFRIARKRTELGVQVGFLLPAAEHSSLYDREGRALALLQQFDSRALCRLQALADGILILGSVGALAEWLGPARLIRVSEYHAADEAVDDIQLAATLVHETTHAWLNHHGIQTRHRDGPVRRARVEAICIRSEAAFLRRVPNGETLAGELESLAQWALDDPEAKWSEEAFDQRRASDLRELGVPEWLIRRVAS